MPRVTYQSKVIIDSLERDRTATRGIKCQFRVSSTRTRARTNLFPLESRLDNVHMQPINTLRTWRAHACPAGE